MLINKKLSVLFILCLLFLAFNYEGVSVYGESRPSSDPIALYLTWQQDPTSTMTIDWHTIDEGVAGELYYRMQGVQEWTTITGENHPFPYSKRTIYRTELTGLQPGSKYEFRFGDDSPIYLFRTMPGQPGYNVLDFGDYLSFVLLDSGHVNPPYGTQKKWLKNVLSERQHIPHVFPVYHLALYPSVRDFYEERIVMVREPWVPLFEEYGVRLAFENHDHAYKRTHPLRNGEISSDGIVYIGDGSWGTVPREVGSRGGDDFSEDYWYIKKAESVMHFILLTIDGPHQHMLMIDSEGNIIDEYPETPWKNILNDQIQNRAVE